MLRQRILLKENANVARYFKRRVCCNQQVYKQKPFELQDTLKEGYVATERESTPLSTVARYFKRRVYCNAKEACSTSSCCRIL